MGKRGVTALVTDGTMRDAEGVVATGLPVWCTGAAAPSSVAGHIFTGWQEPIGCGGVAVFPGDIIVADGDGAVVIPIALVEEVAKLGDRAGAVRELGARRGAQGRAAARPLSAQRGHQGALRGGEEEMSARCKQPA